MYLAFSSEHTAFIAVPPIQHSKRLVFVTETHCCFFDSEVNLYTLVRKKKFMLQKVEGQTRVHYT